MTYLISLLACLTDVPNSWCPKPNLPCSFPALPYPQSSSAELTTSPCSVLKPQNHAWLLKSHAQSFNKSCRFNLQNIHKPWQWCACLLLPAWPRHHHRHRFSRVLLQKFPDGSSRCYSFSVCQLKKKLKYSWFTMFQVYSKVIYKHTHIWVFKGGSSGKESTCQCRRCRSHVQSLGQKDPWRRK